MMVPRPALPARILALSALLACGSLKATQAEPTPTPIPPEWKMALVFKTEKGQRIYVGAVDRPAFPKALAQTRSTPAAAFYLGPVAYDYEIWYAANGATRALWYSSQTRDCGNLSLAGRPGRTYRDAGTVEQLIREARPFLPQPPGRFDSRGIADYPGPPNTLAFLCDTSDVIAVGRAVGVLRNEYPPFGAGYVFQHTVYVLAVEECLKTDTADVPPALLTVWQTGGTLPWIETYGGTGRGVGFVVENNPMLNIGSRYCLFLKGPDAEMRRQGYAGVMVGGKSGIAAYLDEYRAADPIRAKLLLRDGYTQPLRQTDTPEYRWRFESGPQILGVPEKEAIDNIRLQVERAAPQR